MFRFVAVGIKAKLQLNSLAQFITKSHEKLEMAKKTQADFLPDWSGLKFPGFDLNLRDGKITWEIRDGKKTQVDFLFD